MMRRALVVGAMVALAGCGDKADLCSQAVRHMIDPSMGPAGSKPGKEEQQIIDVVVKITLDQCRKEGLSRGQADCILAAKTLDQRLRLIECPAIKASKPTWLQIPDAEGLRELEDLTKDLPGPELDPEAEKALLQELENAAPEPAKPAP
mgnify:CR=1 FL=1